MEISRFDIDFVERTRNILLDYADQYDMSIVINCTLGLIILPYEKTKNKPSSLWLTEIDKISNLPSFELKIFEPIKSIDSQTGEIIRYPRKTLKVLLQKMRNGLAHQDIEPKNKDGKFSGVIIRNYFDDKRVHKDLEIHFDKNALREFALFIADEYLKKFNKSGL